MMRLLLAFSLILASVSPGLTWNGRFLPSADCAVCGGVCCCPEKCAPQKTKFVDSHYCGRPPTVVAQRKNCDQSVSICRLSPASSPMLNNLEKMGLSAPPLAVLSRLQHHCRNDSALRRSPLDFLRSLLFLDVPTPPPKPTIFLS